MTHPRLSLALDAADALPSSGRILVLNARAGFDCRPLPQDRVSVVQGFRPDHDALATEGYDVAPALTPDMRGFAASVVFLPRARAEARALVAAAAAQVLPGAPVWIDGQKTDGIDAMFKDVRTRAEVSAPIAKAHGKIFRLSAPDPEAFADWQAVEMIPAPGFITVPGVFSAERVDRGSELLAEALPADLTGTVGDLGAGWGWLAAQILLRGGAGALHLIEADHAALGCARRNVTDPRAVFHWADVRAFRPAAAFDAVVTNPPFHAGRAADPALGVDFIRAAARMLKPTGVLFMVANRHLPYEAVLTATFRDLSDLGGDGGFKLFRAARPLSGSVPRPRR